MRSIISHLLGILALLVFAGSHSAVLAAPRSEAQDRTRDQIRSLQEEKLARTPIQRKLDSQIIYALRQKKHGEAVSRVRTLKPAIEADSDGRILVDIRAKVTAGLEALINRQGGVILSSHPKYDSLRALVPLEAVEAIAAQPVVRSVAPAARATTNLAPREGDLAHRANEARFFFDVDGTGMKIGVLSDDLHYLTNSQALGALPPIKVLPGQAGDTIHGEGTAMLEIIHSLAPASELHFATAFGGVASFAQNIRDLQAAGCQIIVDDVTYYEESPFQDGIIAQAVNDVSAAGVLFFSSAGNSGNKDQGTSSTWEGDFKSAGEAAIGRGGVLHDFGEGATANAIAAFRTRNNRVDLFWADPLGASANDYDLYVVDPAGNVIRSATNTQDGQGTPYENLYMGDLVSPGTVTAYSIVVVKFSGEDRYLHISAGRDKLTISTAGATRGHNASGAPNAFGVAAIRAPVPAVPFDEVTTNRAEFFSSDGPRRMFFHPDGSPITPGNFSSTGGLSLQKPDFTAANGVTTTVPGFERFYGTSAAAPHAAAIAALLWSANPFLPPDEVRAILSGTALDIEQPGVDRSSGAGVVMAYPALAASPRLRIDRVELADANRNGTLDPNECADLRITLRNESPPGSEPLTNITAVLTTLSSDLRADPAPRSFANMAAGESAFCAIPFRVSTTPGLNCASNVYLRLIVSPGNQRSFLVPFRLGSATSGTGSPRDFLSVAPVPIPDNGAVEAPIQVEGVNLPLAGVSVGVHIKHPYDYDLKFSLISPDGTEVVLSSNNGQEGSDYGAGCQQLTWFGDSAATDIKSGTPPFIGAFKPEQPLAGFVGKVGTAVNGLWKLKVQDQVAFDSGVLECWTLRLVPMGCHDGGGECLLPPVILSGPASQTATNGDTVRFAVTASGTQPLSYQWYWEPAAVAGGAANPVISGQPIAGASGSELVLSNLDVAQAGTYSVLVSNPYGQQTARASLAVSSRPVITCGQDKTVEFGAPWSFDPPTAKGNGVVVSILGTESAPGCGVGYSVTRRYVARDADGIEVFCSQTVNVVSTVPPIMECPQARTVMRGTAWDFGAPTARDATATSAIVYDNLTTGTVEAINTLRIEMGNEITLEDSGGYPTRFEMNYWGVNVEGGQFISPVRARVRFYAKEGAAGTPPGTLLFESGLLPVTVGQRSLVLNDFRLGASVPLNGALPTAIVWTVQFSGMGGAEAAGVMLRGTPTLGAAAEGYWERTGSGWAIRSSPGEWFGARLEAVGRRATVTVASTVTNLLCGNSFVAVRTWEAVDACGNKATCSQSVTVEDDRAPVFERHPDSVAVVLGGTAVFESLAASCHPVSYQWYFNNGPISGATNATLRVEGAGIPNRGGYFAVASNKNGSCTGAVAQLTLAVPPGLLFSPSDQTVAVGGTASFSASAEGTSPLSFQWYLNETNALPGATGSTLLLENVSLAMAGSYRVKITNAFGSVTSGGALLVVTMPPALVIRPFDKTATNGDMVVFTALAEGTPPLSYQWYYDTITPLVGATAPSLTLPVVQASQAGTYTVVVTNRYGEQRASARLAVNIRPTIACGSNRTVDLGAAWEFDTPTATGINVAVSVVSTTTNAGCGGGYVATRQFKAQDEAGFQATCSQTVTVIDTRPPAVSCPDDFLVSYGTAWEFGVPSAPGSTLRVTATETNRLCAHSLVAVRHWEAVDVCGNKASCSQTVTVVDEGPPVILQEPLDLLVLRGQKAVFSVAASSCLPMSYQWCFEGTPISGDETNAAIELPAATVGQAGAYTVVLTNDSGAVTSAVARLTVVVPPSVATQPLDLVVTNGDQAVFEIAAEGTGPLGYQWFFNETNAVAGGDAARLLLSAATPDMEGAYHVVVTNVYGSAASSAAKLEVLVPAEILVQPVSQVLTNGDLGVFTVLARGTAPLTYQWFFNGAVAARDATNATLALGQVSPADVGFYTVVVSNAYGFAISAQAALTVVDPPLIVFNPASQSATNGQPVELAVEARGTEPLSYQWYYQGNQVLEGATSPKLAFPAFNADLEGSYEVLVVNPYGTVRSAPAQLTLVVPPLMLRGPGDITATNGETVVFSVKASGTAPLTYRWIHNETNVLSEATDASLTLPNVTPGQRGIYTVVVSNPYGEQSASGSLIVLVVPTLDCAANKTVELGAAWDFDAPTAGGVNPIVSVVSTTTNTACGATFSAVREWEATDDSGLSVRCAQTVRVVDTQPPTMTCAASRSARFGEAWDFEAPQASDSNGVTVHELGTRTNVICGNAITAVRTWEAADACGNKATCSQTITVADETAPVIIVQPKDVILRRGGAGSLSVTVSICAAPAYQWYLNGNLAVERGTNTSLSFEGANAGHNGLYHVVVSNAFGVVTSAVARVTVVVPPGILVSPVDLVVTNGDSASFDAAAEGDEPLSYQWYFNRSSPVAGGDQRILRIQNAALSMAGTYNLVVANAYGSATSAVARLTVAMAPIVLSQPRDLVATNGDVVVFSVTAQGTAPLSYQWFLNETVPLAGATGSELNLGRVALAQAGRYSVVVTNAYGTVASTLAQLTVVSGPEIQSQPKDREVSRGSSASFDVVATGNPAPSFQWLLNGTPVPDATNASLVIDNVQEPNLGLYSVVVSNSVRSITSAPARLSLLEGPPRILAQPSDATAIPGGTARFSVSVFSTTPVSCQWYFNGDQPVSGATSETLDLAAISIAQRGSYHVALSNEFGVTLSASAQLRVLVKPEMLYFSRVGDLVTFTFSTETNLLYTLYYADQPNPGNWILMPKPAPQRPGNGLPMSIQDPKATNGGRFYKILVE